MPDFVRESCCGLERPEARRGDPGGRRAPDDSPDCFPASHERRRPGQDRGTLHDGRAGRPDGRRSPLSAHWGLRPAHRRGRRARWRQPDYGQTSPSPSPLLGLFLVKERRIPGRKSLTNVITVISKEWASGSVMRAWPSAKWRLCGRREGR